MRSFPFVLVMIVAVLALANYTTAISCDVCMMQCSGISESTGCSNGPNYYSCTSANRQRKANCQSSCRNRCSNQQAPASSSRTVSTSSSSRTSSASSTSAFQNSSGNNYSNSATNIKATSILLFLLPFIYWFAL